MSLLHFPSMNNFLNEQIADGCSTAAEPDINSLLAHIIYSRGLTWLPLLCSHLNINLFATDTEVATNCCGETNFGRLHMMERKYLNRK